MSGFRMNNFFSLKQKFFRKASIVITLYLAFTSILISFSIPLDIETTSVEKVLQIIKFIGLFSGLYLAYIIVCKISFGDFFVHMLKILLMSALYFLFHFYLFIITTLNNSSIKFSIKYFIENIEKMEDFKAVFLITGIFIILSAMSKIKRNKNVSKMEESASINLGFFILLLATDNYISQFVFDLLFAQMDSGKDVRLSIAGKISELDLFRLYGGVTFLFIVLLVIVPVIFNGFNDFVKNRNSIPLAFMTSLLLAFVFNYSIQNSISIESSGAVPIVGSTMFQVLIFSLFFLSIYLIISKYILSTVIILVFFSTFTIANGLKFSVRSEPIYISDFSWLANPKLLLSFIDIKIVWMVSLLIIFLILATILLSKKFFRNKVGSIKSRIGILVFISCTFGLISQNFRYFTKTEERIKIPFVTDYLDMTNGDILWRGLPVTARYKSQLFVILRQSFGEIMDKPERYSEKSLNEIAIKYRKTANEINKTRTELIENQTVIFILSESLANPNRVEGISFSKNPLVNIDAIKNDSTGGLMYSNGYGGGTANMEIQALTSLPMINFSTNVSIINSDVIPSMNFVPSISNQFEYRIAIHPENGSNYNRNVVYKKLGFQHFFALYGTSENDKLTNQEQLSGKVSDEQTYNDILQKIDENKNQFFSVLTMQNHMPYDSQYNNDPDLTITNNSFNEGASNQLADYSQKINTTDKVTKFFLEKLQKLNKKITVVFYGDHLPGIYSSFNSDSLIKYETDYFIWNNQANYLNKHQNINAAEFVPLLLETQNAKVSPYQALLTEVLNKLPSEYNSGIGNSVELTSEQKLLLNDLKLVQYDLTEGKGYLSNSNSFYQSPD